METPLSLSTQFGDTVYLSMRSGSLISVSALYPHPECLCLGPSSYSGQASITGI